MSIELTDEQTQLIKDAVSWYRHSSDLVFQYTAPAGAGKSTVMHCIINALGLSADEVAPMTYVGSAAIVMRVNGFTNACTAHSWLYQLQVVNELDPKTALIVKRKRFVFVPLDKSKIKLICIDEASTMPFYMKKDIEANGIKIIACGDLDQLPPVKDKPAYLYEGKIHYLTKIMRQSRFSSIVEISNMLRSGIQPKPGNYGQVLVIPRSELSEEMVKASDAVICGTNKTRDYFNAEIRKTIIGTDSKLPQYGEKVVCRKNDWQIDVDGINLANGLAGTVTNSPSVAGFKGKKFTMDFTPDLFPNITFRDLECDYEYFVADYKRRITLKSFDNKDTVDAQKFEFAYAITTHIAQGSQFMNGIYIQEYLNPNIQNKLNYTGITRFRNYCIYVLPYTRVYYPVKLSVVSVNGVPVI